MRTAILPVGYKVGETRYREVSLRPLTGKTLLSARARIGETPDPSLFLDILAEAVAEIKGFSGRIHPGNFFWVDADYIFKELAVWESEESGDPLIVRRRCQRCGEDADFTIDPHVQEVICVEETEFGKYPDLMIPFKLHTPITTFDPQRTPYDTGKIALLTVEDEVSRMKRYANQPGKFWVEGIRLMIAELGPKKKGEISLADIETLTAMDLKRLERLYNANEPGLRAFSAQICPRCSARTDLVPQPVWAVDFLILPATQGRRAS